MVKISELLIPYLLVNTDAKLSENVVNTLCKICETGDYNRSILKKYVEKYGEVKCNLYSTTLNNEMQKYPNLYDFIV